MIDLIINPAPPLKSIVPDPSLFGNAQVHGLAPAGGAPCACIPAPTYEYTPDAPKNVFGKLAPEQDNTPMVFKTL